MRKGIAHHTWQERIVDSVGSQLEVCTPRPPATSACLFSVGSRPHLGRLPRPLDAGPQRRIPATSGRLPRPLDVCLQRRIPATSGRLPRPLDVCLPRWLPAAPSCLPCAQFSELVASRCLLAAAAYHILLCSHGALTCSWPAPTLMELLHRLPSSVV